MCIAVFYHKHFLTVLIIVIHNPFKIIISVKEHRVFIKYLELDKYQVFIDWNHNFEMIVINDIVEGKKVIVI